MYAPNYEFVIKELRTEIEDIVEKDKICGLAIALVDRERIIWSEGFGFTDFTKKEEVTANTLFSTQSMGKTITATTFMIMASKGLINLDDSIRKYYPEFTVNSKFGDKEEEIAKITFRKMLGHFAGFTHEAPIGSNYDDTPCTFEEHIASINNIWLRSKVGSEFAYSNLGIDLTAYVLGKIQKKAFQEVVKDELFHPLGIVNATLDIQEARQQTFAKGHIGEFETPTVQVPMLGAGGVYISVNDQAKFAMFHLNKGKVKGKQLITEELFEEMYKSQFEKDGIKLPFGLGLYKESSINNAEVYSHGGGGYGYLTQHTWVPKYGLAAIVFTNDMHHNERQLQIARKALELMVKEKSKPSAVEVPFEKLKRLIGSYYTYRTNMHYASIENRKLVIYDTQGNRYLLYPQNDLEFLTEDNNKIKFVLGEQGKAKFIEFISKGNFRTLKYNDGPNDQPGPNEESWKKHLGIYEFSSYGLKYYFGLGQFNGYLYLYMNDKWRLEKYQENLYFTPDGESLILSDDKLIYRNFTLTKTDFDIDELLKDCNSSKFKREVYKGIFNSVVGILYYSKGFENAYDFILEAIAIDDLYHDLLSSFGILLYYYRKLNEAKQCFNKLVVLDENNEKAKIMLKRIEIEQE
ncbi:MAG TPA: serine hydrolase domain-containing protein [candidate division Zixibacteria bacterium]|nr:serine hydrolase domain-containing protein [candidate division Zixibacteria bacterium]